ncbi:MAG: hypothetical protein ACK5MN_12095 [Lachnospiraceae bacterium]
MDTALKLRLAYEARQTLSNNEITELLLASPLIQKLTSAFAVQPLSATFRLLGLSEVPHIETLRFTQDLLAYGNETLATGEGFSCLGGIKEIVPCYNAMLLEAYSRLGLAKSKEAQAALHWICQYQIFDRRQSTRWPYHGICKHGGCMGAVPCYIGIGKTVRALLTYREFTDTADSEVEALLQKGCSYMLRHRMYCRLSDGRPISPHITDFMMPQSYALSLTDLVYIVRKQGLAQEEGVGQLLQLLKEKEAAPGQWKLDYVYRYEGYVGFETRRGVSEWISKVYSLY